MGRKHMPSVAVVGAMQLIGVMCHQWPTLIGYGCSSLLEVRVFCDTDGVGPMVPNQLPTILVTVRTSGCWLICQD